jgi:hypothetical protein
MDWSPRPAHPSTGGHIERGAGFRHGGVSRRDPSRDQPAPLIWFDSAKIIAGLERPGRVPVPDRSSSARYGLAPLAPSRGRVHHHICGKQHLCVEMWVVWCDILTPLDDPAGLSGGSRPGGGAPPSSAPTQHALPSSDLTRAQSSWGAGLVECADQRGGVSRAPRRPRRPQTPAPALSLQMYW